MTMHQVVIMYFSLFVYTLVLIWGLRMLKSSFKVEGTLLKLLSEDEPHPKNPKDNSPKPSFSRLAGAVGSMGLAAVFIGIGYWVIFALFTGEDITRLDGLGPYFLSGSALFAPYAFNKLARVFKI